MKTDRLKRKKEKIERKEKLGKERGLIKGKHMK